MRFLEACWILDPDLSRMRKFFKEVKSYVAVDKMFTWHEYSGSKIDFFYDGLTLQFSDNQFDSVFCFDI